MTLIMDECFSSPRRPYTRQCTHSTKRFLTITTCKSVLPSAKLSCAMVGSSNCDFASLHTWWHWPSSQALGEARPPKLAIYSIPPMSDRREACSPSRLRPEAECYRGCSATGRSDGCLEQGSVFDSAFGS